MRGRAAKVLGRLLFSVTEKGVHVGDCEDKRLARRGTALKY